MHFSHFGNANGSVKKQNEFSRVIYNDAKLGAYYTDVGHAKRIGRLFRWPKEEEVCVLEPSIGNGAAVLACTEGCAMRRIYGVELNADTYNDTLRDNPEIYAIHADFLSGVKISNGVFSFCFANPPYGMTDEGERLEKLFIEKMHNYIGRMGMLALVIPYQCLVDEKFLKPFFRRFTPLRVYKFDDKEYEKYHQVAVIAQKNSLFVNRVGAYDKFFESIHELEKIPYLPDEDEEVEQFEVFPSADERIQYFTTLVFNAESAAIGLGASSIYKVLGDRGFPKTYESLALGRPPVPLSKDNLYLMAICGAGQGLAGSVETKDLHLQRGVVKLVTDREIRKLPYGEEELVETTHSKMTLITVENDGKITVLE